jgi:hypothetical protein
MLRAFHMTKCVKEKIIMGQDRAVGLIFETDLINKVEMMQFLSQFQFTLVALYLCGKVSHFITWVLWIMASCIW